MLHFTERRLSGQLVIYMLVLDHNHLKFRNEAVIRQNQREQRKTLNSEYIQCEIRLIERELFKLRQYKRSDKNVREITKSRNDNWQAIKVNTHSQLHRLFIERT